MLRLRRFVKLSLIPAIVLVPFWLTIGRALLGSVGWLLLIMMMTVVPAVLIALIILAVLILRRPDTRKSGLVSVWDARLMALFYGAVLLFGFFVVDFGDTEDSIASVATHLFGHGFATPSMVIALLTGGLAAVTLLAALVVAIIEFRRAKRQG